MLRAQESREEGFGLVEVVVAIFILGLLAVAVLPMIWTGLRIAGEQSTTASATQLVSSVIEEARTHVEDGCAALPVSRSATDGRGKSIALSGVVVNGCSGVEGPIAVKYTATARASDGSVLASATTRIYLPAEEDD